MRTKISLPILLVALSLVASCATTPPEKPKTETTQPEKPVVPAPDAELAQAKSLQQRVDAYSLGQYAPDDYAAATQYLKSGQDAYGKDNAASKQSLQASIAAFNAVITKGGPVLVQKVQDQSVASKRSADDLKASVAVKDDYAKAEAVYQNALKEKAAGDLEKAGNDFATARDMFDAVAKTAQQKKDTAMQSMEDSQKAMAASEQKAADAQKALRDEGITPAAGQ
jgi:hypothetical protein